MDGYYRAGQLTDHKVKADEAVAAARGRARRWTRSSSGGATPAVRLADPYGRGRYVFVDELLGGYRGQVVEPVSMPAEAPLFLMYTSDDRAPQGCVHSTGGDLAYVAGTSKYYQDTTPATCTGAWPTSAGSPAIPTSFYGPLRRHDHV